MVFVTVGNATGGFRRLLDAVDRLAGEGFFNGEPVLVQSGNNPDFAPRHCEARAFLAIEEFRARLHEATLVICHGGATQLEVVRRGKIPVVMPRRRKYREIVNDHQLQLARLLAERRLASLAMEVEDLPHAIGRALSWPGPAPDLKSDMLRLVDEAICELIGRSPR